jgi:hypothetical protein
MEQPLKLPKLGADKDGGSIVRADWLLPNLEIGKVYF